MVGGRSQKCWGIYIPTDISLRRPCALGKEVPCWYSTVCNSSFFFIFTGYFTSRIGSSLMGAPTPLVLQIESIGMVIISKAEGVAAI
jgi:hypothetical protein